MESILLNNGRHTAALPKLTFGAGELVGEGKQEEYKALLDLYYQKYGGRSFDTARVYSEGRSEAVLGEWLRTRRIDRSEVFITTKGGHPPVGDMHACRLDRASLEADLSTSLSETGLEYFDLYLLHRDCEAMPVKEIMETLNSFVTRGAAHFIGVSNWRTERIAEANRCAEENGFVPLSVSQINFSLARTTPELLNDDTLVSMTDREYRWYLENRFPVMAFSAQAKGFFAKLGRGGAPTPKIFRRFMTEQNMARLARVKTLSAELRVSPGALALAYLLCIPLPTSAVFRCQTPEQLEDSMQAQSIRLTPEQLAWLETGKEA